jgi:hypothetical protein
MLPSWWAGFLIGHGAMAYPNCTAKNCLGAQTEWGQSIQVMHAQAPSR